VALARLALPGDAEAPLAGAVHQQVSLPLRQPSPRAVDVDAELGHDLTAEAVGPARLLRDVRAPGLDRALVEGERVVGYDQTWIDLHPRAQAIALDTHALGAVEREALWRELGEGEAAVPARHLLGVDAVAVVLGPGDEHPLPDLEGRLDGLGNPRGDAPLHDDAIHHRFDGVLAALVESLHVLGLHDLAVDAQPHEAGAPRLGDQLAMLALAVREQRCEQDEPRTLRRRQQLPGDLLGGLSPHRPPAAMTVLNAHARVEDAQVVGDLRDGSDGGARVGAGRLLLDRDRR
jgi:hypothetical protein